MAAKVVDRTVESLVALPSWVEQLRLKFTSGVAHTFILTGNTRDIVDKQNTILKYLAKLFLGTDSANGIQYDIVAFYDRANGLSFAMDGMGEAFRALMVDDKEPAKKGEKFAAVMATNNKEAKLPSKPLEVLHMMERIMSRERVAPDKTSLRTVFIMDFAESVFPAGEWSALQEDDRNCIVKILGMAKNQNIQESGNPVILICDTASKMHEQLISSSSRIEQIEILLPSPAERYEFIQHLQAVAKKANGVGLSLEEGFDLNKFANLTAGLKRLNLEDVKLQAEELNQPIGPALVKERKREIMSQEYQRVIEVVEQDYGFEAVGGMEWLKDFHIKNVITPMVTHDVRRCPQGLLYIGPAGTGKSWFARALAKESRLNMVALDIGKLLGGVVGESEHNMQKALLAIRSLVPVLVWMDEIDQAISRGSSGDSGVSNRLFKMILEFMSDTRMRGQVLFIAATNRPDMMDPALKRTGRFDKKIPFLPPNPAERAKVLPAIVKRYDIKVAEKIDYEDLATGIEGWVQSDMEAGIMKAYSIAGNDNRDAITQEDIATALQKIIPSTQESDLWTKIALMEVNDLDLLPPDKRGIFDRKQIQREVKTLTAESVQLGMEEHQRSARQRAL